MNSKRKHCRTITYSKAPSGLYCLRGKVFFRPNPPESVKSFSNRSYQDYFRGRNWIIQQVL